LVQRLAECISAEQAAAAARDFLAPISSALS
jgi:hypothetical protein